MEKCNFCGLSKNSVDFLVNGPGDLYICNVCIESCMDLWKDFQREEREMKAYVIKQHLNDNLTK